MLFRIKPGIDAHTHNFIRTGQIDSKFGFALETGEALQAVAAALKTPGIRVAGIHCHIGSQIFDIDPFCHAAEVMLGFAQQVRAELGYTIEELNLGGGFGIRYVAQDDPKALESYMEAVSKVVLGFCETNSFPVPFICIEPGRSIVGGYGHHAVYHRQRQNHSGLPYICFHRRRHDGQPALCALPVCL